MAESSDSDPDPDQSVSDLPTIDSEALETLASRLGGPVDPAVDLDPVDSSDAETLAVQGQSETWCVGHGQPDVDIGHFVGLGNIQAAGNGAQIGNGLRQTGGGCTP